MAAAAVLSPTTLPSTSSDTVDEPTTSAQEAVQSTPVSASELIISRISSVLRSLSYNDDSVHRVASRVNANIVHGKVDLENITTDNISQFLDTDLLDREKLGSRNLHLNSNEPVLLLEISEQNDKSTVELTQVKNDFVDLLRMRSIVPVRVYVRKTDDLRPSQFGFCLLNVVNTDIGGPSMVQLLDAAFHGEGWKKDLIIKEAFNGETLLWRDEVITSASVQQEQQRTTVFEPERTQSVDIEADVLIEPLIETVQKDRIPQSSSIAYRDVNEIPEDHDEDQDAPTEHPAMVELRQWEASRQHVEHPSWAREHDGDLLDIITTQSASIKDEDTAFTTKPASEDFELVEKL